MEVGVGTQVMGLKYYMLMLTSPPLSLCLVQVLCGRQVFPEEQHDPVPVRLRGGANEGGLRSPGPLTLVNQQEEEEEE